MKAHKDFGLARLMLAKFFLVAVVVAMAGMRPTPAQAQLGFETYVALRGSLQVYDGSVIERTSSARSGNVGPATGYDAPVGSGLPGLPGLAAALGQWEDSVEYGATGTLALGLRRNLGVEYGFLRLEASGGYMYYANERCFRGDRRGDSAGTSSVSPSHGTERFLAGAQRICLRQDSPIWNATANAFYDVHLGALAQSVGSDLGGLNNLSVTAGVGFGYIGVVDKEEFVTDENGRIILIDDEFEPRQKGLGEGELVADSDTDPNNPDNTTVATPPSAVGDGLYVPIYLGISYALEDSPISLELLYSYAPVAPGGLKDMQGVTFGLRLALGSI